MAMPQSSIYSMVAVLLFSLTLGSLVLSAPSPSKEHHVSKRHILQMCELIVNHTNRGCFDYYNYGCYCGLGNAASTHVDGVDGCCRIHDECYGEVACFWIYPQFVGYSVKWEDEVAKCTDNNMFSPCQFTTCQCDLEFARCLGRQRYNYRFRNFDRRECHSVQTSSSRRRRSSTLAEGWRALIEPGEWES